MKIVIIGYGQVGRGMHRTFPDALIIDGPLADRIIKGEALTESIAWAPQWYNADVAFVCVPTEMNEDGSADTTIVERVVKTCHATVVCIKSTVPPRFTNGLISQGYRVVMSPEFTGATQHSVAVDDGFVILGGREQDRHLVAAAYKQVKSGSFRILMTDALTAELVKYGENSFLYAKVAFFNEFARICRAYDVDIDEWRELLLNDPRIGRSHTFVYDDHPWIESHCLDKDIPAIISASADAGYTPEFLIAMTEANAVWKEGGPL